jgi:hypothetical protein
VVDAGPPVGGGRPLVEDPLGGTLPKLQALIEDARLAPELEHPELELRETDPWIDRLERGQRAPSAEKFAILYDVATVTVRVIPRSSRPGVEQREDVVLIRVKAPPAEGRATEEARRRLAEHLGVAPSRVRLRSGAASRTKVFEVT